jgi:hypothetical protein
MMPNILKYARDMLDLSPGSSGWGFLLRRPLLQHARPLPVSRISHCRSFLCAAPDYGTMLTDPLRIA